MNKNLFLKSSILLMLLLCGVFGLKAQNTIFFEDFSGFADSAAADLSSSLDNYTTMSGWSGSKVYQNNGKVKLGTASSMGWLQTPAIDLSANGGSFTLEFDAVAWYHDSTTIIVYLDNTSYEVTGLGNDGNYGSYGHFSLSLTGGTSNSHIKFEGKQNAKARFFLDNVTITQSGGVPTVAAPTISVSGNAQSADTYFGPVTVTLSAGNGTSIHYTLDGTEPTSASTLYTAPFTITETTTIKAIAISGDNSSSVVTKNITILNMTPVFFEDFESNGLNEMMVTNVSGTYEWGSAVYNGNTYAYANAYNHGATESWLITPAITPLTAGGVTLSFTTAKNYNGPDLQVKYSTDYNGSGSPVSATWTDITSNFSFSSGSWSWTESGDVVIAGATPLYFAWVYTSEESSAAAWELDNILVSAETGATSEVAAPVFTPAAGTYTDSVTFSLTCATEDAEIRYTTDGTVPTEASALYSNPITLTTTTTVKAKAFKPELLPSTTVTAAYVITNQPALNDSVIYAVGFEDAEGFTANNTYNNTTVVFTGAEGAQWGTYHGTPSTNNHITGEQSMQMRWYTSNPDNIGYTYTNFDLQNVTHVTFAAANSNGLNVNVSHSIDGGSTYTAGETFTLESTANTFNYVVDENGSYDFVRLKFTIVLPETNPIVNSRVIIDSVVVFGVPGQTPTIVATPVINPAEGSYYEPQTVTLTCADADAVIRYTLDDTEPTENSTVYSQPFTINSTTTIKAKAWKDGMTPSLIATATISFPEQVANIAAFKAAAATNEELQIMSDVTFVFRSGRFMYVEDNSAALLIYDYTSPVITSQYNEGDVIEGGIFGKYTLYQGMVEMLPTHNPNAATGTPVTVTPTNATITDIKAQYTDVYEAKLVHLSNVTFINANTFVQNGDTMAIFNRFNTISTEISAGDVADVTGFVSYSTTHGYQIYPRGNEDIDIHPVVIMDTVDMPVFDVYRSGEFYFMHLTCATDGADIYYTQDGSDPDETSIHFISDVPLQLTVHYTLKAIAMKEGMVNSAIAVYDYNPSGIDSHELRDNLNVYPNPANNIVFISMNDDNALIEHIELFNTFGQLLHSINIDDTKAAISVRELATGTYYAKIFTNKGIETLPVIRK